MFHLLLPLHWEDRQYLLQNNQVETGDREQGYLGTGKRHVSHREKKTPKEVLAMTANSCLYNWDMARCSVSATIRCCMFTTTPTSGSNDTAGGTSRGH